MEGVLRCCAPAPFLPALAELFSHLFSSIKNLIVKWKEGSQQISFERCLIQGLLKSILLVLIERQEVLEWAGEDKAGPSVAFVKIWKMLAKTRQCWKRFLRYSASRWFGITQELQYMC